ncbi:MAG: D-alanyl-D-alanine carboxypeptidase family protein [Stellaceae bacterium]
MTQIRLVVTTPFFVLLAASFCLGLATPGAGAVAASLRQAKTPIAAPPSGPGLGAGGMPTFATDAREAMVVDYNAGTVLLAKNIDQPMPTASLSKIMTAYLVFQYLKEGRIKLSDALPVSEKAWRTGGSKMFVPYHGHVSVSDLLRGMLVESGNDACVVLAQGLAGSTEAFVAEMNAEAKKLGLTHSHFANVDGLPDPSHYMSARDIVTLAEDYLHNFPQYYPIVGEKEFTFDKITQHNRNPLLYKHLGVDGIKTGHTQEAGYSLLASAVRHGRRIILLVSGLDTAGARARESENLLNWAYRAFVDLDVAKPGLAIDEAPVWYGVKSTVPVSTRTDTIVTVPRGELSKVKITAVYDGEIKAPIAAGKAVGTLEVALPDGETKKFPLVTLAAVKRLDAIGRIADALAHYLWGTRH